MKPFLIQPHHESEHPDRERELRHVEALHNSTFGLEQYRPAGRPTFTELFQLTYHDRINIIANSDIEIDPDTLPFFDRLPAGTVWCLSRWDFVNDNWMPRLRRDSQDVWAVRGALVVDAPFAMGTPGCDNRLAHILKHMCGMKLDNPVWSIVCRHHHKSDVRTYMDDKGLKVGRLPGPFEFVKPSHLP